MCLIRSFVEKNRTWEEYLAPVNKLTSLFPETLCAHTCVHYTLKMHNAPPVWPSTSEVFSVSGSSGAQELRKTNGRITQKEN